MATYNLQLPRMGESVSEATIVKWLKQPGDSIEEDEPVLEIATDKVDSDVPSPVSGILKEQLFAENDIAQVGDAIAVIETESVEEENTVPVDTIPGVDQLENQSDPKHRHEASENVPNNATSRFYSPLVKSIAAEEGLTIEELDGISGTGNEGRVTKQDILHYLEARKVGESNKPDLPTIEQRSQTPATSEHVPVSASDPISIPSATSSNDEIIEMDRMRRLIADHMVKSVQTSPHVCSFVEADVTNLVNWRNKVKTAYEKREGEKITFTPIFVEAVSKAIRDFPMINISVNGTQIIKKRNINVGMATALPSGNLIVPVIKHADQLSLVGLSKVVNDLANRARTNQLKPDDTQDGTFTLTNIGAFGNIMGTPIINQPQVAILAVGTISKKPAVIETEHGDLIGIRHMMYLSLSYDHRVVDGALGGRFVKRVADYLENWDMNREI